MKIKIPSHISLKINEVALKRDVIDKSFKGKDKALPDSNKLIGLAEHRNGVKRVYQFLGVEYNGVKYLSALPSPTHLFLSAAVELYQISEQRKNKNFINCGKQLDIPNSAILDFEQGDTNECFTDFLKTRSSSIIMLVSALENFMNQQIPNDYTYIWFDKKNHKKKKNHDEIENNVSFNNKLEYVIPDACKSKELWKNNSEELNIIKELYSHRKEFVHLKTKSEKEWKRYFEAFDNMVKFDMNKAIQAVIKIMNIISPEFVLEDEND